MSEIRTSFTVLVYRKAMIHMYSSQFSSLLFCRLLEDGHGILQVNFEFKCCRRIIKIIFTVTDSKATRGQPL